MKYKYILYGVVAISALAIANIYLWQKDAEDREINETAEIKEVSGKTEQKSLSDDFEYPAPVKQLQQVLVKSYQPPVHEGEDIFPDELLTPDDEASIKTESKKEIDDLRKRIEAIKLTPEGES